MHLARPAISDRRSRSRSSLQQPQTVRHQRSRRQDGRCRENGTDVPGAVNGCIWRDRQYQIGGADLEALYNNHKQSDINAAAGKMADAVKTVQTCLAPLMDAFGATGNIRSEEPISKLSTTTTNSQTSTQPQARWQMP